MRKCNNCGFENKDDTIICQKCNFLLVDFKDNNKADDEASEEGPVQIIVINNQDTNYKPNNNKYKYNNGYYEVNLNEELFTDDDYTHNQNLKSKNLFLGIVLTALLGGLGNIYAGLLKRGMLQLVICAILYYLTYYVFLYTEFNFIFQIINIMWNLYLLYDTYLCINAINTKQKIPAFLGLLNI